MKYSFSKMIKSTLSVLVLFTAAFLFLMPVSADEHSTTYGGVDYAKVYDYDYYTTNVHPAFAGKSDKEVLQYFVKTGIKAGEQANETFSVKSYRNANQDLRKKYGNQYSDYINHYLNTGYSQNRDTLGYDDKIKDPVTSYNGKKYDRVYDFQYYVDHNKTVRKKYAFDDFGAIKYFVTKGMKKKHQACEAFNVLWYYYRWDVLRVMWGTNWEKYYDYYQRKGYRKGATIPFTTFRKTITTYRLNGKKYKLDSIYDYEYYTKHNSSAYQYWKNKDDAGAIKHFVNYGMLLGYTGKAGVTKNSSKYRSLLKKLHPNLDNNAYFKANEYSSKTKWLVLLNQGEHKIYVFKGKQGAWSCERVILCTVGKPETPTPTGVFHAGGKGLYFDSENCRCWYFTQISGTILFHSILYTQESGPYHVLDGRLGMSLSHGCVRVALSDAKWIQDHIPTGTTIVSYNRPW
jgi:hypothetical protein